MTRYRFGPFLLDARTGRLLRTEEEVTLQPLAFQLLHLLLQRPGELLTRDELAEHLWPGVAVTPNSLEQVVRRLRKALAPEAPLRTVPRRGYRFDADVLQIDAPLGPAPRGNLRAPPGRFVGRSTELADLRERVARGERLLTLTGPGGAGKTALAHELALASELPGWFVDLSHCRSEADVVHAVARVLDLSLEAADPVGHVGWALDRLGHAVVLLDNFEQVVEAAPPTVGRWLRDAPDALFVVTSRIVLGLRGERVYPVEPLSVADGLALFADRAGLAGDDPDTVRVVRALDGLPLAIELAARRARVLPPAALLARLEDRFTLLSDPGSDRPARHRSLDAALATSWELLDPAEAQALCQLTVFEGAFELSAAEAVVDGPALNLLQGLVDQSLLRALPGGRFALLDTVRDWTAARADADARRAAEIRHALWFTRGEALGPDELDDAIAASRRAVSRGDASLAARAAIEASKMLRRTGAMALSADMLEKALAIDDGEHRMELLLSLVPALESDRPEDARRVVEQAIALARERGDARREAILLLDLSTVNRRRGDLDAAERIIHEALPVLRACGDRYHEGLALTRLGAIASRRNDPSALALHESALAVFRSGNDLAGLATATVNVAIELDQQGRGDEAEQRYREALDLYRQRGNRGGEANARGNLAVMLARSGRTDAALAELMTALRLTRELGARRLEAAQLGNLGALHLERGELTEAASVLGDALRATRRIGNPGTEAQILLGLARLHRERGELHAAEALLTEGLDLLERIGESRLLANGQVERAALCVARSDLAGAREAMREAAALSDDGRALDRYTWAQLARVREAVGRTSARSSDGPGPG